MSEKNLYQQLKISWKYYIKRIEPKDINQGIPDCHLVNKNKNDIFVELKYLAKEFKEKQLPIKKSQFIWHNEYDGKFSFILFKIDNFLFLFEKDDILKLRGKISWDYFVKLAILKTNKMENVVKILECL